MNRMLNLSASFFVLALLFFSSCGKENLDAPQSQNNQSNLEGEINFCLDNPDNPYEYVGVEHNAALDALAASPDFGNLSIEDAHAIANQSVMTNLGNNYQVEHSEIAQAYELIENENGLSMAAEGLAADGIISPEAMATILELDQLLEDSPDPLSFAEAVMAMEADVMSNNAFTETEKAILLGGMSIARHSTCYWVNAALDVNNPWYDRLGVDASIDFSNQAEVRGWWKRVKRAFRRVVRRIRRDITGYKYAYRYSWILTSVGWKRVVISAIVGIVYSWF